MLPRAITRRRCLLRATLTLLQVRCSSAPPHLASQLAHEPRVCDLAASAMVQPVSCKGLPQRAAARRVGFVVGWRKPLQARKGDERVSDAGM